MGGRDLREGRARPAKPQQTAISFPYVRGLGGVSKSSFPTEELNKANGLKVSYGDAILGSIRRFHLHLRPRRHENWMENRWLRKPT